MSVDDRNSVSDTVEGNVMPNPPFLTGIENSVASRSFGGDLPVSAGIIEDRRMLSRGS